MQVPQWADAIPMSRRGSLGSTAMTEGCGHDTASELGTNTSISDSKLRTLLELLHS